VGNNNSLAHRCWRKGLIALAVIWAFIFLAAAGEAIHTRISVPSHHRTQADLLVVEGSLAQTRTQLDQVEAWALCLKNAKVSIPRRGTIDFLDGPALCSDPR
jgi:hypothetical protein